MSSEELVQMRLDFENKLLEICPKGMYFPVIEYECEEDISLQFYSKAFGCKTCAKAAAWDL